MHQILCILSFSTALCLASTQEAAANPCDRAAQIQFISSLPNGVSCGANFGTAQSTPNTPEGLEALNNICTTDCAGEVADYLRSPECTNSSDLNTNLENIFDARFLELWCLPAENADIPRCRFALDQIDPSLIANSDIFSCLNFTGGECPSGCSRGLNRLASGIGCCYQSIYNSTDIVRALSVIMAISREQVDLFAFIQDSSLWDACEVGILDECTAKPFSDPFSDPSPEPTFTTTSSPSGASPLIQAITVTITVGLLFSFLLY